MNMTWDFVGVLFLYWPQIFVSVRMVVAAHTVTINVLCKYFQLSCFSRRRFAICKVDIHFCILEADGHVTFNLQYSKSLALFHVLTLLAERALSGQQASPALQVSQYGFMHM